LEKTEKELRVWKASAEQLKHEKELLVEQAREKEELLVLIDS